MFSVFHFSIFRCSVVPSLDSRRRTGLCPRTYSIERVGNLFLLFSVSINSLICGKCGNCQLQIINFAPIYFFWSSCSTEVQQELHSSTSFWFFTNSLSSSHFSHSSSLVNPRRRQFSVNAARTLIVKSSNTKASEYSIASQCANLLAHFPHIKEFIDAENSKKRFPTLSIEFVRGHNPVLRLESSDGTTEDLNIEKWKTENIEEFLATKL